MDIEWENLQSDVEEHINRLERLSRTYECEEEVRKGCELLAEFCAHVDMLKIGIEGRRNE